MTKLIAWLKSLFTKQPEVQTVSEPIVDVAAQTAVDPTVAVDPAVIVQPTPAQEVKAGVQDFEAAYKFVVAGIEQLGAGAEDELKSLAKKYL